MNLNIQRLFASWDSYFQMMNTSALCESWIVKTALSKKTHPTPEDNKNGSH